jgi:glycosyltransferase involved in cell wall biosynthesis
MPHPDKYSAITGWNIIGTFGHSGGLGNAARGNLKALRELVSPRQSHSFPSKRNRDPRKLSVKYNASYLHFNPNAVSLPALKQTKLFSGRNIGYWAWETTLPPESWLAYDEHMTQIWVPSNFVKSSLLRAGFKAPIFVIPHAVHVPESLPRRGAHKGAINFLVTFDGKSRVIRKCPETAIAAIYRAAQEERQKCNIVIKCHDTDDLKPVITQADFISAGAGKKWVTRTIIDGWLDERAFESVWQMSDTLVSLNRGEGFGLPMVEAMARGVAVIATNCAASTDYLTADNSFPVDPDGIVPCNISGDSYFKTGDWAEPSFIKGVEQIRRCIQEIKDNTIKPRLEAAWVTANDYTHEKLVERMSGALKEIK